MALKVWLRKSDVEYLSDSSIKFDRYGDFKGSSGVESISTGITDKTGLFSSLRNRFVVGKVKFWEYESSKQRTPFVRIDGGRAYEHGLILTPHSWLNLKFLQHSKTIDQLTDFNREDLLGAHQNDFVRRVFTTYYFDAIVPKPTDFERHFLLYCDERHLNDGRV